MEDLLRKKLFREVLPFVQKPVRYAGGEYNSVVKELPAGGVRMLLAFPETYEIGMSFLGFKILYGIINSRADASAERVFAPWLDMEKAMKDNGIPLYSLETFTPAKDFDCVGFTLQYEMTFTNILSMLDLAGIPLAAKDRDDNSPLVLGGGPCAYNPEPVAEFFDAILIGDGEEAVNLIVDALKKKKQEGWNRQRLLLELSRIQGMYIPSFYRAEYAADGGFAGLEKLNSEAPDRIRKALLKDFDSAYYPVKPVIPYAGAVQDRIMLEIMRGCTRGCRFCISGMTGRPVRERGSATLSLQAEETYKNSGYDEISLASLSSTDHSCIEEIAEKVSGDFESRKVSVSLPSSRIDAFSAELAGRINPVRRSTLTFALEAATERLRRVINKDISEEELLKTAAAAFKAGWPSIKLYFMLGLPTETEEDVLAIAELSKKLNALGRASGKGFKGITINVAFYVPKPHTPFQWEAQDNTETLKKKIDLLRSKINPRWIRWHSLELSLLEGVFARGDRRLSSVVLSAYRKGARFDAWGEVFAMDRWLESFKEAGVSPEYYACRKREITEKLPWSHIDPGVTVDFLLLEKQKAEKEELTPDCRPAGCLSCGLEPECSSLQGKIFTAGVPAPRLKTQISGSILKVRVKYSKEESAKFLSHLDVLNTIHRLIIRSGVPAVFTSGFNPHLKTSFSPALPVGVYSAVESFDLELYGSVKIDSVNPALQAASPSGIRVLAVDKIPAVIKSDFSYAVYETALQGIKLRKDVVKPEAVENMNEEDGRLVLAVKLNRGGVTSIYKLLAILLDCPEQDVKKLDVKRIKLF
ncbi:MAG: TIGR03960 family B12-binding radical SAM protein [Candidatus Firestonebacteria bacterium]